MAQGREHRPDARQFWTNFGCVPHRYLYESHGIRRGMWTLAWFLDLLGPEFAAAAAAQGRTREDVLEAEAADVPAGSDGLMSVLDWLAPGDHPYRKGIMLGFDARHTRGHVYRSILEAIALTMADKVEAMRAELGTRLDEIVVSGGGSTSPLLMQIFADAFGVPASRALVAGGASLGAAICVAVATGLYPGFDAAITAMTQPRQRFAPQPVNVELYRRIQEAAYRDIRKATDTPLQRTHSLFQ
jgi:sugar (pentulose or hexulose) kinase